MRRLTLLIFVLLGFSTLKASETNVLNFLKDIEVGKAPIAIIPSNYGLQVFCKGYDANSNGILDEGDEAPSWWTVKNENSYSKLIDFNPGFIFKEPFIPAVRDKKIYIPTASAIQEYNILSGELLNGEFIQKNAEAASIYNDYIFLSVRNDTDKNEIQVYNMNKKDSLYSIPASEIIQKTIPFFKYSSSQVILAALSEGIDKSKNGSLQFFEIKSDGYELLETFDLGAVATSMNRSHPDYEDYLLVTMKETNQVKIFQPMNLTEYEPIENVVESAYGPMNAVPLFINQICTGLLQADLQYMCVTSLDGEPGGKGKAYIYSPNQDGRLLQTLETHGGCGAAYMEEDRLYIANLYKTGSSEPDNVISIYYVVYDGVEAAESATVVSIHPNPSNDLATIKITNHKLSGPIVNIQIANQNGALLGEYNIDNNIDLQFEIPIRELGLNSGAYYARISSGDFCETVSFTVLK